MTRVRIALVVLACAAAMTAASFVPRLLNVGRAVSDAPGTPRSAGFVATTRPAGTNLDLPAPSPARAGRAEVRTPMGRSASPAATQVRHPKALRTPSVVAHPTARRVTEGEARSRRAMWDRLVACEAPGRGWRYGAPGVGIDPGYHFEGGPNYEPSTWRAYRLPGYPAHAYDATPEQQITVAERVLAAQGWRAWPVCSKKLGLR